MSQSSRNPIITLKSPRATSRGSRGPEAGGGPSTLLGMTKGKPYATGRLRPVNASSARVAMIAVPARAIDAQHFGQRPKIEDYDNFTYMVVHGASPDGTSGATASAPPNRK